ncbi:MAG: hypothetical protein V1914_03115 [archaeon]
MSLKYLISGATMGIALVIGACQTEENGLLEKRKDLAIQVINMRCESIGTDSIYNVIVGYSQCTKNNTSIDVIDLIETWDKVYRSSFYDIGPDGKVEFKLIGPPDIPSMVLRDENEELFKTQFDPAFRDLKKFLSKSEKDLSIPKNYEDTL